MKIQILKNESQDIKNLIEEYLENSMGIEEKIVKLETGYDSNLLNSIFKPIYSSKESFATFAHISSGDKIFLNDIYKIVDSIFNILVLLRDKKIVVSTEIVDAFLLAVDTINIKLMDLKNSILNIELSGQIQGDIILEIDDIPINEIINSLESAKIAAINLEETTSSPAISVDSNKPPDPELDRNLLLQFFTEAQEYLSQIERNLLDAESKPEDEENINSIFRALHSMKGGSALILSTAQKKVSTDHPLQIFKDLSHSAEAVLQKIRDKHEPLKGDIINKLFVVIDNLKNLIEKIQMGRFDEYDLPGKLIAELKSIVNLPSTEDVPQNDPAPKNKDDKKSKLIAFMNVANQSLESIESCHKKIRKSGFKIDSKTIDKYLRSLKNLISSASYQNYTEMVILLKQVKDVLNSVKEGKSFFDNILCETLEETLESLKKDISNIGLTGALISPPVSEPIEEKKIINPGNLISLPESRVTGEIANTLRVRYEKVDKLMNLIGELIVTKNMFSHISKKLLIEYNLPSVGREVKEIGSMISRIADDLQNTIMDVRMMSIKSVFQKFPRMIRDMSKATGKEINLVLEGEDTQLDKTIIEKINDPLVHLIRNAVDHGIESEEQRNKKGKNPKGTITLRAETHGNIVSIEISDDGRGIDTEEIKLIALEKELISFDKAEAMTPRESYDLLFLPGFSTAKKVSEISGRGVGLDVVKTNINSISGLIDINSELGKGTTIKLLLPLTLVISKGLVIKVSNQNFILPLEAIQETVKIQPSRIHKFKNHYITEIRGEVISLIPLAQVFNLEEVETYIQERLKDDKVKIVILNINGQKAGLLVNDFSNEQEIVIKPLNHDLARIKGISGATIMGDGKIVLILNPNEIMQLMVNQIREAKN